ncbi:PREDICTED: uncharacterized protein LOC105958204 [Erythranthe guttata]|uniref:uncharacterized protein LOC105958204 n=1 Tax=Erythranthe guttata TaxID=4155 RepID=UPI00064E0E16|nr:PREDICTED: uncharacterized protein LOC105958204 [Erythranthe guttata]|eukprot:XP_012837665.1 PREDICTED: uncharacterized protein LOC105958204 [Erythranthe guttata]
MAPYEALYGRKCRSPIHWDEVGEQKLLGPELVQHTVDIIKNIREKMKSAQDRQQKYANKRRRDLEFNVGDHVFLKVAPLKGIMRFGNRGKLSPRYIGPFEILNRIGTQAYRLALPPHLSRIHNVFHVSMLQKYLPNPDHVLEFEPIELSPNLSFIEEPVQNSEIKKSALSKFFGKNHSPDEATWELEDEIESRYPELIEKGTNFGDEISLRGEDCNTPRLR